MQTTIGSHVSEDLLVRYASGHLEDGTAEDLEEHILVCESCQSHLEAIDEYMRVGAQAAKEIREKGRTSKRSRGWSWEKFAPRMVWGGALAALLLGVALPSLLRNGGNTRIPSTEVSLTASRGTAQTLVPHSQAGNLTLKIDVSELPNLPMYHLQLVNASGGEIWSGPAVNVAQKIRVAIPHPLGSGQYWVRLLGRDNLLIREFDLEVD